jgi:hypothetical protein
MGYMPYKQTRGYALGLPQEEIFLTASPGSWREESAEEDRSRERTRQAGRLRSSWTDRQRRLEENQERAMKHSL